MNIEAIVRAVQKELGVDVDGKAGPATWEAIHERMVEKKAAGGTAPQLPPGANQKADERSEKVIAAMRSRKESDKATYA